LREQIPRAFHNRLPLIKRINADVTSLHIRVEALA